MSSSHSKARALKFFHWVSYDLLCRYAIWWGMSFQPLYLFYTLQQLHSAELKSQTSRLPYRHLRVRPTIKLVLSVRPTDDLKSRYIIVDDKLEALNSPLSIPERRRISNFLTFVQESIGQRASLLTRLSLQQQQSDELLQHFQSKRHAGFAKRKWPSSDHPCQVIQTNT